MSVSEVTLELVDSACDVHEECFPAGTETIETIEKLSFLLGVPVDDVDELVDVVARRAEEALGPNGKSYDYFVRAFMRGIEFGRAAERRSRLELDP